MKAKDYVKQFGDLGKEDAMSEILQGLCEEASLLAKQRNCHGGAGTNSTFGAYADCYFEQFVKWVAICRLDSRFELSDFVYHLGCYYPQVLTMTKRKMVPYFERMRVA